MAEGPVRQRERERERESEKSQTEIEQLIEAAKKTLNPSERSRQCVWSVGLTGSEIK